MCFTVPKQVTAVKKGKVVVSDGSEVVMGSELTVHVGDFVQTLGNMAVGTLNKTQGERTLKLINQLSQNS